MNKLVTREVYDKLTDDQKGFVSYMQGAFNPAAPEHRPEDVDPVAWERGQQAGIRNAIDSEE